MICAAIFVPATGIRRDGRKDLEKLKMWREESLRNGSAKLLSRVEYNQLYSMQLLRMRVFRVIPALAALELTPAKWASKKGAVLWWSITCVIGLLIVLKVVPFAAFPGIAFIFLLMAARRFNSGWTKALPENILQVFSGIACIILPGTLAAVCVEQPDAMTMHLEALAPWILFLLVSAILFPYFTRKTVEATILRSDFDGEGRIPHFKEVAGRYFSAYALSIAAALMAAAAWASWRLR